MNHSTKSVSPLRQRMIEDMTLRKLGARTQISYIRAVVKLTRYLGRSPDTATAEDLRGFQLHMVEQGDSAITVNATLSGLTFFFDKTLDRPERLKKIQRLYEPRKIPEILSAQEVTRLLHAAGSLKELLSNLVYDKLAQAAALPRSSASDCSIPFSNRTPLITFATCLNPRIRRQFFCAH